MNQILQDKFLQLPEIQQAAVQAATMVEVKILELRRGPMPEHQIERALADHRKKAHAILSPEARLVVEGALRDYGILKLGHVPAPAGMTDWSKNGGGAPA
ncbi:hypothetical protein GFK26_18155 [Variovorax paradoxus]|uniref:Uncharacterized protein n=1 Tax=Variovorax paradoxus TaxID=34073 RepID=A0A5Q0M838_VARPD|nr:hypothetical protein [Variovorax paradoxus]QFZ84552.1 hypothetical protein GFK26_18155 [Variovorax paradoxus]